MCLIAAILTIPSVAQAEQPITGVLVFPVSAPAQILKRDQGRQLKGYLTARLTMEGFNVMPEQNIRQRLIELKIRSYEDCYDEVCRMQIGKALSADRTLSIEVFPEGQYCRITAIMYDIRTEVTIAAGDKLTNCDMAALRSGLAGIASQLSSRQSTSLKPPELLSFPDNDDPKLHRDKKIQHIPQTIDSKGKVSAAPSSLPVTPGLLKFERTQTEWVAMRFNGGNYGGGIDLALFTLRWPHFVWEIVRGGANVFGPGFGSGSDSMGFNVYAGTAFGYPLHIGDSNKHEVRFMTGIFAGGFNQNLEDDGSQSWEFGNQSVGPFVLIEVCYVLHLKYNRALQTGISLMVPTYAVENDLPDPALHFFIGFRI